MFSPGFHQVRQVWGANITEERVLLTEWWHSSYTVPRVHKCTCVCMYVHACVHVRGSIYAYAYGGWGQCQIFFSVSFYIVFETRSLPWSWSSPIQLAWLNSKCQGSPRFCPPQCSGCNWMLPSLTFLCIWGIKVSSLHCPALHQLFLHSNTSRLGFLLALLTLKGLLCCCPRESLLYSHWFRELPQLWWFFLAFIKIPNLSSCVFHYDLGTV